MDKGREEVFMEARHELERVSLRLGKLTNPGRESNLTQFIDYQRKVLKTVVQSLADYEPG